MSKEEIELWAENIHNVWLEEVKRQVEKDPYLIHPNAKPYNELTERVKDYDRALAVYFLNILGSL